MAHDVAGADFDRLVEHGTLEDALGAVMRSMTTTGLQATEFGRAQQLVRDALYHKRAGDVVIVSYTSNLVSSGLRECFAFLAQHCLVDAFVSTAGGVEEDVIKCMGPTYLGSYQLDGKQLRMKGLNRVGNLIIPNNNYCAFEDFFTPILRQMHARQRECRWTKWTAPSEFIAETGKALEGIPGADRSVVYWCYRNGIPFFSPAFTDGSMGDMIYFYNFSKKGLVVDPLTDIERLQKLANPDSEGPKGCVTCIILGGGLPKHFTLENVNATTVLLVTTGLDADGSTSSCNVGDDRACGQLKPCCTDVVRVHGDATLLFPLMLKHDTVDLPHPLTSEHRPS